MVQEIAMPTVGNASAPYHPSVLVLRILMANPKEFSLKVPDPPPDAQLWSMDGRLQAVPSTRVWPTDLPVRSFKGRWLLIKGPFLLFHGPCIFNPHPQTMFHIYCVPCFFPHSHIFSCGSSYFSMNRLPLRGALACPFGLILRAYETIADLWNQAFRIPSVLRPAIAFGVVFINIQSCLNMDFQWFSWIFCRMSLTSVLLDAIAAPGSGSYQATNGQGHERQGMPRCLPSRAGWVI